MPGPQEILWRWLNGYEIGHVTMDMADSPGVDAFGRGRISAAVDIFDSQFWMDEQPFYWDSFTTGTAAISHVPAKSAVQMQVSAVGSVALRQTRGYFRYQPGMSQLIDLTYLHEPTADTLFRVGYYDDNDGIFLEHNGLTANVVLRTSTSGSVAEQRIPQSEWNSDRMQPGNNAEYNDRYAPSGVLLDHSKAQHLVIDFQWLGVGRARIGFYVDGLIRVVHKFKGDNIGDGPFMRIANLPLRYELRGLAGITGARTALQICASIHSEGGANLERGLPFVAGLGYTGTSVSIRRPVLSIRPKATLNGIMNRVPIENLEVEIMTDEDPLFWELIHGGIISGSSWQSFDSTASVEMDRDGTLIFGGKRVDAGFVPLPAGGAASGSLTAKIMSKLRLALGIQGEHPTVVPTDNFSIVVTNLSAGNTDVRAIIRGLEQRG